MLTAHISHQKLILTDFHAAGDSINYLSCRFCFATPDWDGLDKWAHFEKDGEVYHINLTGDRIRPEDGMNLTGGAWKLYLHGDAYKDGQVVRRITTEQVVLNVLPTGTLEGQPFGKLPPSEAEQILARLAAIENGAGGNSGSMLTVFTDRAEDGTLTADHSSGEIIEHLKNGGCTRLQDIDAGEMAFLWNIGGSVLYGTVFTQNGVIMVCSVIISGSTADIFTAELNPADYAKLTDVYTKDEINAVMGSYIADMANLIGGDAIADS